MAPPSMSVPLNVSHDLNVHDSLELDGFVSDTALKSMLWLMSFGSVALFASAIDGKTLRTSTGTTANQQNLTRTSIRIEGKGRWILSRLNGRRRLPTLRGLVAANGQENRVRRGHSTPRGVLESQPPFGGRPGRLSGCFSIHRSRLEPSLLSRMDRIPRDSRQRPCMPPDRRKCRYESSLREF